MPVAGGTRCQRHRAEHPSELEPWGALAQCLPSRDGSLPITSVFPLLVVPWRRPESGSAAGGQAEESQGISLALKGCDGRGQRSSCVFTTLVQPSRLN